jgi:hypothetical protein
MMKEHGTPLPSEWKEFLVDQAAYGKVVPTQFCDWLVEFNEVNKRVLSPNVNESDNSMFWIMLNQIFEEALPYFEPGSPRSIASVNAKKIWRELSDIKSKFNGDELLWIEHERSCRAHIAPSYYRKTVSKNKNGKWTFKFNYQDISIDKLHERLQKIIRPHGGNSRPLAKIFATRIASQASNAAAYAKLYLFEVT